MQSARTGCGKAGLGLALSALFLLSGCGPELDPISRVESLRIIGVQKSAPYARPGERVDLHMLYEDGRETPAATETFFAFWCVNPPGDLFSQCLSAPPRPGDEVQFVSNSTSFSIDIPEDSLRDSLVDPSLPRQGMAVVFYGVCAGRLDGSLISADEIDEDALDGLNSGQALIPRCLDEDGNELGSDDFVLGYSTILIYEDLRNQNPRITGFKVEGKEYDVDCIDADCDAPFPIPELDGCVDGVPCIKACEDDGEAMLCPEVEITALIDEDSAEQDSFAKLAYSTEVEESIWVSYFVDRGNVAPQLALVNDATKGWQSDYGSAILAPQDPGPLRIWAAARDNRGGVSWTRLGAYVKR